MLTFPKPNIFSRALILAALFIVIGSIFAPTTPAQKYPIALQTDTTLSPRNKVDYEGIVKQYKADACLGTDASCVRNVAEATRLRNDLIFIALAQSDAVFKDYQQGRRHKTQIFELFLDILEIGLSTATSITNGERAKTVVSDILTFVQLSHKSADKNLLLKETQVLFNAMIAKRARVKQEIVLNMAADDSTYSYPMALMDVVRYYAAGTIDEALGELESSTALQKQNALNDLQIVSDAMVSNPATKSQRDAAVQAGRNINSLLGATTNTSTAADKEAAVKKLNSITAAIDSANLVPDKAKFPDLNAKYAEIKKADSDPRTRLLALKTFRTLARQEPEFSENLAKIDVIIADSGK
jgi:hypothetical protein